MKIISWNFPPKGWAFCNGQLLPINQNQALFSISTNKIGDTSGSLSIANVIFQNGNNTNASGGATFDYLGGAVDFFGCAPEAGGCTNIVTLPVSSLTLNIVRFLNNTAAGCGAGNDCGGGLDSEFGPTTIANAFFSGNTATLGRGGALTLVGAKETMSTNALVADSNNSAQEGGGLYVDFQNTGGTGSISTLPATMPTEAALMAVAAFSYWLAARSTSSSAGS